MNIAVHDIGSTNLEDHTLLPDVVRLGLGKGVKLVGIWDDPNGIVINLDGPFVIAGDGVPDDEAFAYKYLMIREPHELH